MPVTGAPWAGAEGAAGDDGRRSWSPALGALAAPLVAAAAVECGLLLGWRGVDLPAQVYRIDAFRAHGFALWDSGWFGGHWTLDYSVLFPPVAALAGLAAVTVVAAALAALAFDRLVTPAFGTAGRAAAIVFGVGTVVPSAIGQLPFLAGAALGLCAGWAASRHRWVPAAALAAGASLFSPLAGGFVVVAIAGWVVGRWATSRRRDGSLGGAAVVALVGAAPIVAAAVLFPGQGPMPYPGRDYAWEMAVAGALWWLAGRDRPVLRAGIAVYAGVATVSFVVPSPVGGNVGRLEDVLAVPLAVALMWSGARGRRPAAVHNHNAPRTLGNGGCVARCGCSYGTDRDTHPLPGGMRGALWRWGRRRPAARRLALPIVAVPLVLSQWAPAWGAMTSAAAMPSPHAAYFAPLDAALMRAAGGGPAGRVEVVPTQFHWEAVYVATTMPLARGWERQLDEGDDPLFYGRARESLDASSYLAWLVDNGVRFVALPDAPLDSAGVAEARLVAGGVAGLRLVWLSSHWRLYSVVGSPGIVAAPARLLRDDGGRLVVRTARAGSLLIRVRYQPGWRITSGVGCVAPADPSPGVGGAGRWIRLEVPGAEQVTLRLSLLSGGRPCH